MYALIENGEVKKYPYGADVLRRDNPQISFPKNPSTELLASYNVFPVVSVVAQFDPATQVAEPNGCAYNADKQRWETAWTVRAKTAEELQADALKLKQEIVEATQQRLDDFAKTRSYDGILSACTYAASAVQKFAVEGQYCVGARDAVWARLYEILAEVEAGTRPMPATADDVIALLPELSWPV